MRERHDEFMDVSRFSCAAYVNLRDSWVTVLDVLSNGSVEEVRVLRHHGDVVPEVLDLNVTKVIEADSN
jgi:adenylate cyclase